jgi:hypothetical protein
MKVMVIIIIIIIIIRVISNKRKYENTKILW